ncbi:MAG: alpha-ketoacid dehydrogenase subunit beta [Candidatus Bathyarchaeota archaeon]|nr:alpha-ketoacid dehydrogenase subunit beta [Candidatus Bathyarchaeota archaeon]
MTREITYAEAICEAQRIAMKNDPDVILFGENVAAPWRPATKGLKDEFGKERVRDAPITETAFIGAGVGAAIAGMKPIVELMLVDFSLVAMDQILNQMAKTTYMTGGNVNIPMVLRVIYGARGGGAATHSECLYGLYAHMPGMKIVAPSNPYDAKGLLITAIKDKNPVVFFEHVQLTNMEGDVPEDEYSVPFGVANLVREGSDVTVVAVGKMVNEAAKASDQLKGKISVEVIDPRTLVPLDEEAILRSVAKTGRLVVVDEDYERCGFSAEVAAVVAEKGFHNLKAPVARVANPNVPLPFNRNLEKHLLPDVDKIIRAIRNVVK